MSMFNFESNIYCDMFFHGGGCHYSFNYNITVKIKHGPTKHLFYKDSCHYERYDEIKKDIEIFINNLYERECDISLEAMPNIEGNKNRYKGDEIIMGKVPNSGFIFK